MWGLSGFVFVDAAHIAHFFVFFIVLIVVCLRVECFLGCISLNVL